MQYDCKYFIISIIISTTESVERSYKGGNHEKKIISFGSILFIVLLVAGIILIVGYNSMVDREEEIESKRNQVFNRLTQRDNTIGQLLGAVEGLQEHAENIYQMVTDARKAFSDAKAAGDTEGMIEADAMQVEAVRQLVIIIESNPNVNAAPAFMTLMDEISANENAIAVARIKITMTKWPNTIKRFANSRPFFMQVCSVSRKTNRTGSWTVKMTFRKSISAPMIKNAKYIFFISVIVLTLISCKGSKLPGRRTNFMSMILRTRCLCDQRKHRLFREQKFTKTPRKSKKSAEPKSSLRRFFWMTN